MTKKLNTEICISLFFEFLEVKLDANNEKERNKNKAIINKN